MNKSLLKFLIILLVGSTILSSCKKEEEDNDNNNSSNVVPASKMDLISGPEWIQTSLTIQLGEDAPEEYICNFVECVKDNLSSFLTNLDYKILEGDSSCNSSDPYVISTGEWFFADNEEKVVINDIPHDIINLSATSLKYSRTEGDNIYIFTFEPYSSYNPEADLTCVVDSDEDGVADDDDCAPFNALVYHGASCDDGDVGTENDMIQEDCTCVGTLMSDPDSDGDGVPDSADCAPNNTLIYPGGVCNDGDDTTTNDVYLDNCICAGE